MGTLGYILISTGVISLVSLTGALALLLKEKVLNNILLELVSFAAGSLIGGAFLHLLPESAERIIKEGREIFLLFVFLLIGFLLFATLEYFIKWHHHHSTKHPDIMPFSYLILISDSVHNFIDGTLIAASFVVSPEIGIVTSMAVAFHEIPQEIGDLAIMIYGGFKKSRALFLNFISALAAVLGGIAGFVLAGKIGETIVYLLPIAAGGFIYIASADLIPEIKTRAHSTTSHFFIFLLGITLMFFMKLF